MINKEEAIILATKATDLLSKKEGKFTLTLHDDTIIDVNVLNINSSLKDGNFECNLNAFTNNINESKNYNIYDLKDIK